MVEWFAYLGCHSNAFFFPHTHSVFVVSIGRRGQGGAGTHTFEMPNSLHAKLLSMSLEAAVQGEPRMRWN